MAVEHPDWTFFRGDTWVMAFNCKNQNGTPFDLTGATVVWKLGDALNVGTIFQYTNGGGVVVPIPANGVCTVTVLAAASIDVPPESYFDELTIIKGGTFTMAVGSISVVDKLR